MEAYRILKIKALTEKLNESEYQVRKVSVEISNIQNRLLKTVFEVQFDKLYSNVVKCSSFVINSLKNGLKLVLKLLTSQIFVNFFSDRRASTKN